MINWRNANARTLANVLARRHESKGFFLRDLSKSVAELEHYLGEICIMCQLPRVHR